MVLRKRRIGWILFGAFLINVCIAFFLHFSIIASTCMTILQIQTDNRCLYILSGKVYEKGNRFVTHQGYPCGTDVTAIVPAFHLQNPSYYLLPNYIDDVCPLVSPSLTPPVTQPNPSITIPPTTTLTPIPTPTIDPTNITFALSVFLHGIGTGGDNVNPTSGGNMSPVRTKRAFFLSLFDATNHLTATQSGVLSYQNSSGNFTGTISIGRVPNGNYTVALAATSFLRKFVPGFIQTQQGGQYTLPPVYLTAGDINNDGQIDIVDYNDIISCFGGKQHTASCPDSVKPDLNDDSVIDGVDYNLFLRELSVQKGAQ